MGMRLRSGHVVHQGVDPALQPGDLTGQLALLAAGEILLVGMLFLQPG
jgi:hypothetical protein